MKVLQLSSDWGINSCLTSCVLATDCIASSWVVDFSLFLTVRWGFILKFVLFLHIFTRTENKCGRHCNFRTDAKNTDVGTFLFTRLCGGNGRCECGRCVCNSEWIDSACSCSMETTSCMAKNQMLCNGRGVCECGKCDCIPPYVGATCEECSDCVDGCQDHAACMECRAFRTGAKKDTWEHIFILNHLNGMKHFECTVVWKSRTSFLLRC